MRVARCGIHGFHEVLGIDTEDLRFFWNLETDDSDNEDTHQVSYRLLLAIDEETAKGAENDSSKLVWDSGVVESEAQRDIPWKSQDGGLPYLESACRYFWT